MRAETGGGRRAVYRRRVRAALVLALAVGLVACSGESRDGTSGEGDPRPERIVLVTLDTLRWDAFVGSAEEPAPLARLRALAADGLVFERHYTSSSTTQPTHASLFTGLHPWQHGVVRNGMVLAERHATLAEVLRDAGWWTGAVVASFPVTARFGFGRGFAVFDEDFDRQYLNRWNDQTLDDARFYRLADGVSAAAREMLAAAPADADQFLWVHFFDPHEPYGDTGPSMPLRRNDLVKRIMGNRRGEPIKLDRVKRLYREDVEHLDLHLTAMIEALLADERFRTHVVLTADHGESLGEEGSVGHGQTLNEPEVHVPLLVLSPAVEPGVRSDPCGSADVFATLLSLAGVEGPAAAGRDLLRDSGEAPLALGMRRTFEEPQKELLTDGSMRTLDGYHFYLRDSERTVRGNGDEIVVEGAGLAPEREQDVRTLFRTLEQAVKSLDSTEILDSATQEALKALGYVR